MKPKEFPALVRCARAKKRLSQAEFGELIGCSWITIWRWENHINRPKPDAIGYWIKKIETA